MNQKMTKLSSQENLTSIPGKQTSKTAKLLSYIVLWVGISLWASSCWHTEKDVMKQEKKIEQLSFQISQYIKARKGLVEKYNKLLAYPRTDANKNAIKQSLAQIREQINKYDEKLSDLAKDKIDAEVDLNEHLANLEVYVSPDEPIDPNKWDFLLTIQ